MSDFKFLHSHLVLDACCVINLFASNKLLEILQSIPIKVAITRQVHEDEALWVYTIPGDSTSKQRINLQPFIDDDILILVSFENNNEQVMYVNLSAELDAGESATGAIAIQRNWAIATDDRKSIRIFTQQAPGIQLLTTPELIKWWVDSSKIESEEIKIAIKNIQSLARYRPAKSHSLFNWWQQYTN